MARRILTVGRFGSAMANVRSGGVTISRPIWAAKIYEARARQADGVETWRLVETIESLGTMADTEPSVKFTEKVEAEAARRGLPFLWGCKHGDRVTVGGTSP